MVLGLRIRIVLSVTYNVLPPTDCTESQSEGLIDNLQASGGGRAGRRVKGSHVPHNLYYRGSGNRGRF